MICVCRIISFNIVIILCIFDTFFILRRVVDNCLPFSQDFAFRPSANLNKNMRKRSWNAMLKRQVRSIQLHHLN
jgi:hypothetical protein